MLLAEYDYDTDIAVQREESGRIAFAKGIERGISEGSYQRALETARLMCTHNYPIAEICMMTGLSAEDIANLSK